MSVSKSEDSKALSAFSIIGSRHRRFLEASPAAPIPVEPKPLDQWGRGRGVGLTNETREVCVLPGILLTHPPGLALCPGRKLTLLPLLSFWPSTCNLHINAIITLALPRLTININTDDNNLPQEPLWSVQFQITVSLLFKWDGSWCPFCSNKQMRHILILWQEFRQTKTKQYFPSQQTDKTDPVRARRLVPLNTAWPVCSPSSLMAALIVHRHASVHFGRRLEKLTPTYKSKWGGEADSFASHLPHIFPLLLSTVQQQSVLL